MTTEAQKAEVAYYFEGSCNTADAYESDEDLPLSEEQVLEILREKEIELCEGCGWWHSSDELDVVDDEYRCADCRENDEEE